MAFCVNYKIQNANYSLKTTVSSIEDKYSVQLGTWSDKYQ